MSTIQEILTKQLGTKRLYTLHVPHSVYKIRECGFISYIGNNIWKVGDIEFPLDGVNRINEDLGVIYLK